MKKHEAKRKCKVMFQHVWTVLVRIERSQTSDEIESKLEDCIRSGHRVIELSRGVQDLAYTARVEQAYQSLTELALAWRAENLTPRPSDTVKQLLVAATRRYLAIGG